MKKFKKYILWTVISTIVATSSCNDIKKDIYISKYIASFSDYSEKHSYLPKDTILRFSPVSQDSYSSFLKNLAKAVITNEADFLFQNFGKEVELSIQTKDGRTTPEKIPSRDALDLISRIFNTFPIHEFNFYKAGESGTTSIKSFMYLLEYNSSYQEKDITVQILFYVEGDIITKIYLY